jgi:NitT/TauT family transport system permease protein
MKTPPSFRLRAIFYRVLLHLAPLVIFLGLWQFAVGRIERGTFFYSSPQLVAEAFWNQAVSGRLWHNTEFTLFAVLMGFVLGNLIGILAGTVLSYHRIFSQVATPYLAVLGSVPVLAFAPMIIIWFGIGLASKIAMAAFSTAVVATTQTFQGAENAPPSAILLLESLGASRWAVFRKVIIPASLTWLFSGLKLNIGVAILAVFIGEFISAEAGLGYQIVVDMGLFKTSSVIAGVLAISILSLVLNGLIDLLQRKLMPWARTA